MSLRALAALFFASGIAGLIYQVIWVRTFGRIFGNTVYSASLITAVFMCGLGVGGYLFGRWIDGVRRRGADGRGTGFVGDTPLRAYAYCEIGIAVGAGLLAVLLELSEPLAAYFSSYTVRTDGWHELSFLSYALRYGTALVVLMPITILMGGTLTLLIRYVLQDQLAGTGWRVGLLYGMNTAGAALGAFMTDSLFVPQLGIIATQAVAVVINLVVALVALRQIGDAQPAASPPHSIAQPSAPESTASSAVPGAALLAVTALFLTGAIGMGLELVWFRYISMTLGALRSVFSILLTVILMGLALGAVLGGVLHRRWGRPVDIFMMAQAGLVVVALGQLAAFDGPAILQVIRPHTPSPTLFNMVPALLVAGLPSLFMGVAYPMANACIQDEQARVGRRAGVLYLANTLGAVVGSTVVGFVLIPRLGTQAAVSIVAALGILSIVVLWRLQSQPRPLVAGLSVAASTAALALWLMLPQDHLRQAGVPKAMRTLKLLDLSEDVYELIAVVEDKEGYRMLLTNGHPMSGTRIMDQRYMRAFSHIPLLLREDPTDALVICFGVGSTAHAASIHPTMERLEIVDISEHVLKHHRFFASTNRGVLTKPNVKVFINDGRQHLWMRQRGRYDLVTMEPPPLVFAGVASLYSKEFYALVRSRTKPGGFIAQWLPAYQVPRETIRSMVKAFVEVFPASVLLSAKGQELILLGQNADRTTLDLSAVAKRLEARPAVREDLGRIHLDTLTQLAGTFLADADAMRQATDGAWPVEDDRPLTEYAVTSAFFLDSELPEALIAVRGLPAWCPSCFESGHPHPLAPRLDEYIAIQNAYYQLPLFSKYGVSYRNNSKAFDIPAGISDEVVLENSFLTTFFEIDVATQNAPPSE